MRQKEVPGKGNNIFWNNARVQASGDSPKHIQLCVLPEMLWQRRGSLSRENLSPSVLHSRDAKTWAWSISHPQGALPWKHCFLWGSWLLFTNNISTSSKTSTTAPFCNSWKTLASFQRGNNRENKVYNPVTQIPFLFLIDVIWEVETSPDIILRDPLSLKQKFRRLL